jgi:salicylate hydroxylase
MVHNDISIAVVGGGIGGLSAALCLLNAGFDVQVYEQVRALGEIGAGNNIGPNASRIPNRLGISDVLARTGNRRCNAPQADGVSTGLSARPRH